MTKVKGTNPLLTPHPQGLSQAGRSVVQITRVCLLHTTCLQLKSSGPAWLTLGTLTTTFHSRLLYMGHTLSQDGVLKSHILSCNFIGFHQPFFLGCHQLPPLMPSHSLPLFHHHGHMMFSMAQIDIDSKYWIRSNLRVVNHSEVICSIPVISKQLSPAPI